MNEEMREKMIVMTALNDLYEKRLKEMEWAARQAIKFGNSEWSKGDAFYAKMELDARAELAKVDAVRKKYGMYSRLERWCRDKNGNHTY